MNTDTVQQKLAERFALPLAENYRRRIIFWQDPDGEFASMTDELQLPGVKILKLTGSNNFAAKMLLSQTDTESDYLVYNPIAYTDARDNWLLDIEKYSEKFQADLISLRMQDLNMPDNPTLRRKMRTYSKFFDNKERFAKLAAFHSDYGSDAKPDQLDIDILAVLSGTSQNTMPGVIRSVLSAGLQQEDNPALALFRKFADEKTFWDLTARYTGYTPVPEPLKGLASHILTTALSVIMPQAAFDALRLNLKAPGEPLPTACDQRCYDTVNEWMHSPWDEDFYRVARETEEYRDLPQRFDSLDTADLQSVECFPCIDEIILRRYMSEISEDVVKADDIIATVEKRRTLKWYPRFQNYYEGIVQVAHMRHFYLKHSEGFPIAQYETLWREYGENYYQMDTFYRRFHTAFGKSLKDSDSSLDDWYKSVADYAERLYKNWFLEQLGSQWTALIREETENGAKLPALLQQEDFYRTFVKPSINNGSRVYVIISDALRYEVAAELKECLIRETRGSATLTAVQATFPSTTKFGMAALLPHERLQLTDDLAVLCDGEPTDGTANRDKILKRAHPGNAALTYKAFLAMKHAERRQAVSDAKTVYIYHNAIDAVGDKAATEDRVFDACEQAIAELKNLVRLIVNDLSGTNIVITADHGFLYSYRPLEESDKLEAGLVSGCTVEPDRRYILSKGDSAADFLLRIPMTQWNSDFTGFTPAQNIRIKKQGGGMNYVHGGLSLQECAVPVIEFKNLRPTSKKFVDVKKAEIRLTGMSRKISNNFFKLPFYQPEAVGGKIVSATYEIYMTDKDGTPVSDKSTVIANKTGENEADRVFKPHLTMKSMEYNKAEPYYLVITDKDTGAVKNRIEFTVDIAFTDDFE